MADNVPYKYKPSDSALTEKEVSAAIEFQTSKNNIYEKKEEPKDKVINPFSILLLDPTLGPQTWIQKFKYNKKISDGRLDEVTDAERLLFESKTDSNRGIFEGKFSPKNYLQRDTEKEVDIKGLLRKGAAIKDLTLIFKQAIQDKPKSHQLNDSTLLNASGRAMRAIGG
jgi:hypothetical protein